VRRHDADDVAPDDCCAAAGARHAGGIDSSRRARSTRGPPGGRVIAEAEYAARLPDDVDVGVRVRRAAAPIAMPVLRTRENGRIRRRRSRA